MPSSGARGFSATHGPRGYCHRCVEHRETRLRRRYPVAPHRASPPMVGAYLRGEHSCHAFGSITSRFRSTGSAPVTVRASRRPSGTLALGSTNGSSPPVPSGASTTRRVARAAALALTTPSPAAGLRAWVSRSWGATSSGPNADHGETKSGRAGGAITRPSIPLYMCSHITPGLPWRCKGGRHFTSLTPILLRPSRSPRSPLAG